MSSSDSNTSDNMLDKGLCSNICESMKLRFMPSPTLTPNPASSVVVGLCGSSPPSLSSSPPATDPENNLNRSGSCDKGICSKTLVVNIDDRNYTLKTPPNRADNNASPDQVLVSVSSPKEKLLGTSCEGHQWPCSCRLVASYCSECGESSKTVSSCSCNHAVNSFPLEECESCFHAECAPHCVAQTCKGIPVDPGQPATQPKDVPLTEWSASNVVDWMAACNLSYYSELFKSKDIKGVDLLTLDRDKLISMDIKDERFHKSMLDCIKQLKEGVRLGRGKILSAEYSTLPSQHSLVTQSFNNLLQCDKCGHNLRGMFQQGCFCTACGAVLHRTCAATGTQPCNPSFLPHSNHIMSRVFGLSLSRQKTAGDSCCPLFLSLCCSYLVNCAAGIDYRIYRKQPSHAAVDSLRQAFDDAYPELQKVDLSAYDASTVAYLVKRFLQELPDPVIPEHFYHKFIEGARDLKSDSDCYQCFVQYLAEFPKHHHDTLKLLMEHLLQLCELQVNRGDKQPPTILIRSLCHVIMRPPWDRIVELARNTEYNMKVLEVLLLYGDWGMPAPTFDGAPVLPPRPIHPVQSPITPPQPQKISNTPTSLQEADWYWGAIDRDYANFLLKDKRDGTFLVRDASTGNNEYTLTLVKGGSNKLIKICFNGTHYGFVEPFEFSSVVDLIDHCREKSLSKFNRSLDIRLLYPVSRSTDSIENEACSVEDIERSYAEVCKTLVEKEKLYDSSQRQQMNLNRKLEDLKTGLEAYEETVKWMLESVEAHDRNMKEAQLHEEKGMIENKGDILDTVDKVQKALEQYKTEYKRWEEGHANMDRQLRELMHNINLHRKYRRKYAELLAERGIKIDLEQSQNFMIPQPSKDVYDESKWLLFDCSREIAQQRLSGRPDGTFLIRKSRQNDNYALSISCGGKVEHCLIQKTINGYGFAEPYMVYSSLLDLVVHYSQVPDSLYIHNDTLNTSLLYPVLSYPS